MSPPRRRNRYPNENFLQEIWFSTAKNPHICVDCPSAKSFCALQGRPTHSKTYNLVYLLEAPAEEAVAEIQRCNGIGNPAKGRVDRLLKLIHQRVSEQIGTLAFEEGIGIEIDPSIVFSVAAAAVPRKNPSAATIKKCGHYVRSKLVDAAQALGTQRNVVIPFGTVACKSLQLPVTNIGRDRGKPLRTRVGSYTYDVVPTLSLKQLFAKPNLIDLVVRDIVSAVQLLFRDKPMRTAEEFAANYQFPQTVEEVGTLVDLVLAYTGNEKVHLDAWPIGVDIEATGLLPWKPGARTIAVSVSWDDGYAATIIADHKDATYTDAEQEVLWGHIRRLFECPKPKILHNAQYDYQWLRYVNGIVIENIWWDTMLAEHHLNEDSKGFYKLKQIVLIYAPQFAGYEDQLWTMIQQTLQESEVKLVSYLDASQALLTLPLTENLQAFEQEYLDLTLDLHIAKASKLATAEVDEQKKRRSKLREWIRKIYKKVNHPVPDNARVTVSQQLDSSDGIFELVSLTVLQLYAAIDSDLARRCCKGQRYRMIRDNTQSNGQRVMRELYVPGIYSLSRMRLEGLNINQVLLDKWAGELKELMEYAKTQIKDRVLMDPHIDFNPKSSKDLSRILTRVLGIPYEELPLTETGQISTAAATISYLQEKYAGTPTSIFCYYLTLYKSAAMARNTYLAGIKKFSKYTGRVHTSLLLNGSKTGRLSSRDPNFQNLPGGNMCEMELKDYNGVVIDSCPGWPIKRLIIPTNDDYAIFDIDVSAAEIRVLCGIADDPLLIQAVNDGLDVPSYIASMAFTDILASEFLGRGADSSKGLSPEALTTLQEELYTFIEAHRKSEDPFYKNLGFYRGTAKNVLYGTLYGAGPTRIATQVYGFLATDPDEKDQQINFARRVQRKLFKLFPGIEEWIGGVKRQIRSDKRVCSIFGRYRRFPLAQSGFSRERAAAEREGVNFCIQGPASDLVLSQLCEMEPEIEKIGGKILLTVHDSIVGEIRKTHIPLLGAFFDHWMVQRVKERFPWLPVAYAYGLSVGTTYKDQVNYKKLMSGQGLAPGEKKIAIALGMYKELS